MSINKQNKTGAKKLSSGIIIGVVIACLSAGVLIGVFIPKIYKKASVDNAKVISGVPVNYEKKKYITLGEYKAVPVTLTVTDEDVQAEIDSLLEEYAKVEELSGTIKKDDLVNIDYVGSVGGQEFEGGTEEGAVLEIGAGDFVDGFEDQLIGVEVGTTLDISVTFPEDYGDEELNGAKAVFHVTVNFIVGDTIPTEFNDEFVQQIPESEYNTAQEYTTYIKQYLESDNIEYKPDSVWEQVLADVKVLDYPKSELDKAMEETKEMYVNFADASEMELEDLLAQFGMTEDDMESAAADLVLERMVAKTIAKIESIELTDEYLRAELTTALEDEEAEEEAVQEVTLEELEKQYWDNYCTDPKEDMLVQKVKEYLSEVSIEQ